VHYEFIDQANIIVLMKSYECRKLKCFLQLNRPIMIIVLCNDAEIEVHDGEICQICGNELEEFEEVTGTGIHGYYHWVCVNHVD
jgi:hypothetical protein